MKILVTGGNGFIGRYLVNKLADQHHKIVVLDNFSGSRMQDIDTSSVNIVHVDGDITDANIMKELVPYADMVYHLACTTGHLAVSKDPRKIYDDIVLGGINLLKSLGHSQQAIVFSSSAALGNGVLRRVDEKTPTRGITYDGNKLGYGAGKAMLEELCRGTHNVRLIRLFNIVGPGQTGHFGMVLPRFIGRAILQQPITIYDNGEQIRTYGDVDTFVNCLMKVVNAEAAEQIYNIGSSYAISVSGLVDLVEAFAGYPIEREFVEYKKVFDKDDVIERTPDTKLLQDICGPVKWPTIDQIVARTFEWMQSLPPDLLRYHAGV